MADKFNMFTGPARRVLSLAQEEAQRLNHSHIHVEHLLLGLIDEENSAAVRILQALNVDPEVIRERVEQTAQPGESVHSGKLFLSANVKRVIELSVAEAHQLGHNHIGTEHLLLGVIRSREEGTEDALSNLGIELDEVRSRIVHHAAD